MWSGGFDSTYLVQLLLERGHHVSTRYLELVNNEEKTRLEHLAVAEMEPILRRKFPFLGLHRQAGVYTACNIHQATNVYAPQLPMLLASLASAVEAHHTHAALGYVMHDTAISFLSDMQDIWAAYGRLSYLNPWPELEFPLSRYQKQGIKGNLMPELLEHCVCCENGPSMDLGARFCRTCAPCRRNREAGLIVDPEPDYEL